MKIRPPIDLVGSSKTAGSNSSERAQGAPKSSSGAAPSSGSVQISSLSAQLHALESSLVVGGEFDRSRVEAIKQAIRDGSLVVNPQVIADKMLSSDLALLTKKS